REAELAVERRRARRSRFGSLAEQALDARGVQFGGDHAVDVVVDQRQRLGYRHDFPSIWLLRAVIRAGRSPAPPRLRDDLFRAGVGEQVDLAAAHGEERLEQ